MTDKTIIPGKSGRFNIVFSEAHHYGLTAQEAENMTITQMIDHIAQHKVYDKEPVQAKIFDVKDALKELETIKKLDQLEKLWFKYEVFHKDKDFIQAIKTAKFVIEHEPELDLK